jgi:molybdopterin-guanine dinucleotide biosynthesis protein A
MMPISGAVLAGGDGRRMNRDKRAILIDSQTLLARATTTLRAVSDDVLISCRDASQVDAPTAHCLRARLVLDPDRDAGPLGGLASALRAASHEYLIVVAVDMPFVSIELLGLLREVAIDADRAVVTRSPRGLEPLLAAYPRREAARAEAMLARGERSLTRFVEATRPRIIERDQWSVLDPDGVSFVNWNRPADVRSARRTEPMEARA